MKIAAFDFDGTIYFPDGLAPDIAEAIAEWQAAGNIAVAATGKSYNEAYRALAGSGVEFDYSILVTGAIIADKNRQVVHRAGLDKETVTQLVRSLAERPGTNVYGISHTGLDYCFRECVSTEGTGVITQVAYATPETIPDQDFVAVATWTPDNPQVQDEIHRWVLDNYEVESTKNQGFVDILPAGTTKGAGVEWLARHAGWDREEMEIYSFGDSWNDLSMFQLSRQAFSFPWAPRDVQAAAGTVVDSAAEGLRRLLD
ncbi:HAD-IIB family hydrolase [Corynebacterium sp. 32222D000AT]|uniref:HAD-IIB family hydrolase n=1 Tax=unclassified Corynebacterium TaxID=2624378 RepID=UPI002A9A9C00|nr:HAD family hydrolase [Mycobacteriaceae bacterium]MDY5829602.1 HAD family hydrolase [Corynebacterium sp.]